MNDSKPSPEETDQVVCRECSKPLDEYDETDLCDYHYANEQMGVED